MKYWEYGPRTTLYFLRNLLVSWSVTLHYPGKAWTNTLAYCAYLEVTKTMKYRIYGPWLLSDLYL
jgi:hypothetical protein